MLATGRTCSASRNKNLYKNKVGFLSENKAKFNARFTDEWESAIIMYIKIIYFFAFF